MKFLNAILAFTTSLLTVESSELHGENYVDEEVERSSKITAGTITVSNLIDGISGLPVFLYSVKDLGLLGIPIALFLAIATTKITNEAGKASATRKPGNKGWSNAGTFILLLPMNAVMSGTAIVSPELTLNPSGLAEMRAIELTQEIENRVNNVQANPEMVKAANEANTECQRLLEQMKQYPSRSIQRNDLYLRAYGKYNDDNRDWRRIYEAGNERIPLCRLAEILNQDKDAVARKAQEDWQRKKAEIAQSASHLVWLKQKMPDLYQAHFNSKGYLISGIEATRLALNSTTEKLMTGNWNSLGFSLLFFIISVVSSAGSCCLAIYHSRREDIQASFDESLKIKLDEFFQDF